MYDSPANMPKLRYLYKANAAKGLGLAFTLASVMTAATTYIMYQRKIVTVRKFYE